MRRLTTDGSLATPDTDQRHHAVTLTWLRQAGFLVDGATARILLDPFLTDLPDMLVAPPVAPEAVADVTAVLATHEHIDHLDGPTWSRIAAASARPVFIVPEPVRAAAVEAGIPPERVIGVRVGTTIDLDGVAIEPVPARHGVDVADGYTFGIERTGGDHRFLGYVVRIDGVVIYHAGDTVVYDGQIERLRSMGVDLALLPINGRDYFRERANIVGNLDVREAAELAVSIGVDVVIPMHYDAVPGNTASPGAFVDEVRRRDPRVATVVPGLNRPFSYTGRDPRAAHGPTNGGTR